MDPPVSDPKARVVISEATAAAEPPLEPPGILFESKGFFTNPKNEVSLDDHMANSSILVLPIITASAFFNLLTTVAS